MEWECVPDYCNDTSPANQFLPRLTLRPAVGGEKIEYLDRDIEPGVMQFLFELPLHERSLPPNMRARLETIPKEQPAFALVDDGVHFYKCWAIKRSFEDDGVVMQVVGLRRV